MERRVGNIYKLCRMQCVDFRGLCQWIFSLDDEKKTQIGRHYTYNNAIYAEIWGTCDFISPRMKRSGIFPQSISSAESLHRRSATSARLSCVHIRWTRWTARGLIHIHRNWVHGKRRRQFLSAPACLCTAKNCIGEYLWLVRSDDLHSVRELWSRYMDESNINEWMCMGPITHTHIPPFLMHICL